MANFNIIINEVVKETVGEIVSSGDLLYLATDTKWYKANASLLSKSTTELRIALESGVVDDNIDMLVHGYVTLSSLILIPGSKYYISDIPGQITRTLYAGTTKTIRYVGTAYDNETFLFNPDQTYIHDNGRKVNGVTINVNTNTIEKTSDLINDGSDGASVYIESDEIGAVATSNDYNDLDNLPVSFTWDYDYNDLINTPTIPTSTSELTNNGSDNTSTYVEADEISNIPLMPPYLKELVPDTYLPSTTGNFILRGSFFTSDMTVTVEGHTIISKTFISDNEVKIKLTTSSTEGTYDVTLNNGLEAVFPDQLQVITGTVYYPTVDFWTNITGNIDLGYRYARTEIKDIAGEAESLVPYAFDLDWELAFKTVETPLDDTFVNYDIVEINTSTTGTVLWKILRLTGNSLRLYSYATGSAVLIGSISFVESDIISLKIVNGNCSLTKNGIIQLTTTDTPNTGDLTINVRVKEYDLEDLRIIDLSDTSGGSTDYAMLISQFINDSQYIKVSDLTQYADDTAAGVGGVAVGEAYISSTTGAIQVRLT